MTTDNGKTPLVRRLFEPVEIAPLVYFRIVCGVFLFFQAMEFLAAKSEGGVTLTEIQKHFGYPTLHFKYYGLGWLETLPGDWMYGLFVVLLVASVGIMAGFFYRTCIAVYCVGWGYTFFSDTLIYQNHYYLLFLVTLLMTLVPAHAAFSVDARRGAVERSTTTPRWTLLILRFQLAVVYIGGGVAKISADWLAGEPMRTWMSVKSRQDTIPFFGQYFEEEWMISFFSYSGLFLDLLIVPALLWKRTRFFALAGITLFHLMNSQLWVIGVFPWFMMFATLLFLPPRFFRLGQPAPRLSSGTENPLSPRRKVLLVFLAVYVAFQLVFPFRHFLYPGDANWTEEGARFAWRMKLRQKGPTAQARFTVTDGVTGESRVLAYPQDVLPLMARVDDRAGAYVAMWRFNYIAIKPDAILRFAHLVAEKTRAEGVSDPRVTVEVRVSMNGRKPQLLIDPAVDLATQSHDLWHASWIEPLTEPLPAPD